MIMIASHATRLKRSYARSYIQYEAVKVSSAFRARARPRNTTRPVQIKTVGRIADMIQHWELCKSHVRRPVNEGLRAFSLFRVRENSWNNSFELPRREVMLIVTKSVPQILYASVCGYQHKWLLDTDTRFYQNCVPKIYFGAKNVLSECEKFRNRNKVYQPTDFCRNQWFPRIGKVQFWFHLLRLK